MLKARSVTSEAAAATTERLADWRVLTTRLGDRVEFFDGLKVWVTWLEARLGVEGRPEGPRSLQTGMSKG